MWMEKKLSTFFNFCVVFGLVFSANHEDHGHGEVHVFDEILKSLGVTGEYLPVNKIETFLDRIFHDFTCTPTNAGSCAETMCFDPSELVSIVGGSDAQGINETQFDDFATVVLYHMIHVDTWCQKQISLTQNNITFLQSGLADALREPGTQETNGEHLEEVLEALNTSWHNHKHEHDDEHGSHEEVHLFEEECLAADLVIHTLGENSDHIEEAHFGEVAAFVVFHFFSHSQIKHKCRALPDKNYFIDELFERYTTNSSMSKHDLTELLEKLKLTTVEDDHSDHAGEDDHSGHAHARKKRSIAELLPRFKRASHNHAHEHEDEHSFEKKCYSAAELIAMYETPDPLTKQQFTTMCPSLIYQQVTDACAVSTSKSATYTSDAERYGYGTLAVAIITLCAVAGAALFPCTKDRCYDLFMVTFMGLAVGTLVSDALLHLIPEAFGIHLHDDHSGHDHGSGEIVVEEFVWFAFVTLGGLYIFFLLESVMSTFGHSHSSKIGDLELQEKEIEAIANDEAQIRKIKPLALMIIVGDAVHNFADGLAIGAAFTDSITRGVAVSLAVFCHELPHELGDFAVLLKTGMKFRWAVFWNVMSALTAFIGLYIGLSVAVDTVARQWIFAITAGMFLYIALVDVLPQLTRNITCKSFIFINIGLLAGTAFMIILSVFEGQIKL